jgi:hypothetical protein
MEIWSRYPPKPTAALFSRTYPQRSRLAQKLRKKAVSQTEDERRFGAGVSSGSAGLLLGGRGTP